MYYRLLRRSVTEAQAVIVGSSDLISTFLEDGSSELKDKVFAEFNTLAVLYEMPSEKYIDDGHKIVIRDVAGPAAGTAALEVEPPASSDNYGSNNGVDFFGGSPAPAPAPVPSPATTSAPKPPVDLLGDFFGTPSPAPSPAPAPAARFALSGSANLSAQDFQSKWLSLPAQYVCWLRIGVFF